MEKPGTMDGTSDPGCDQADGEYLETIALLQEEIARLEAELLAHEETGPSSEHTDRLRDAPGGPDGLPNQQELDRLGAELAARDETINLLLDQLRLVEEAESASRAEWEQLAQWVAEVEQRVERQQGAGTEKLDGAGCPAQAGRGMPVAARTGTQGRGRPAPRPRERDSRGSQSLLARAAQENAASSDGAAHRDPRIREPPPSTALSGARRDQQVRGPIAARSDGNRHDASSRRSAENVIWSRTSETGSGANTRSPWPRCGSQASRAAVTARESEVTQPVGREQRRTLRARGRHANSGVPSTSQGDSLP